jgi:hypothetical protein
MEVLCDLTGLIIYTVFTNIVVATLFTWVTYKRCQANKHLL